MWLFWLLACAPDPVEVCAEAMVTSCECGSQEYSCDIEEARAACADETGDHVETGQCMIRELEGCSGDDWEADKAAAEAACAQ